jgi:ATP-dependent DNA ligase
VTARLVLPDETDVTANYSSIVAAAQTLNAASVTLDGEVVVAPLSDQPAQAVQDTSAFPSSLPSFNAFGLVHIDGRDLTSQRLDYRRALAKGHSGAGACHGRDLSSTRRTGFASTYQWAES